MNIEELIARWDTQREEDREKFKKHFPDSDDLLAIVLRGHLLVEEFLDRLNRHCFHFSEYYDQANLRFSKKLLIARAQVLVPHSNPDAFFNGIMKLNELRNNLAHNLDSMKLKNKLTEFLDAMESTYSKEVITDHNPKNKTIEVRVRFAVWYLLGQLEVLDNVVEFMEKSRHYGDVKVAKEKKVAKKKVATAPKTPRPKKKASQKNSSKTARPSRRSKKKTNP